ncbi:hypothetical protein TNCT_732841 [Trichonephila clavata]|uniref:Uncharacterized protein n=1 Tax=Trichonephila clavata TaxID=2740835 RepID=A0A8X6LD91_TRICU|nr:hypothetical protein TNCT_732841 [Trichonephila clavata]
MNPLHCGTAPPLKQIATSGEELETSNDTNRLSQHGKPRTHSHTERSRTLSDYGQPQQKQNIPFSPTHTSPSPQVSHLSLGEPLKARRITVIEYDE